MNNNILIVFLPIILNFGSCTANGPSSESFLTEEICSADGTLDSEFWAWTRQQNELFDNDEKENGIVHQFLEELEQEEQYLLFPPPVIHPIAEKYIQQKLDREKSIETNDENKNNWGKWSNSFRRIGNIFDKSIIKMEYGSNAIQKLGKTENSANLLQILRYDVNLLKKAAFFGGHCIVKSSQLFSSIKYRLNLAADLVAEQYGITQIVPAKIPLTNGKILKIFAIKWLKMRKLKNENGNGEKGEKKQKKYVEEWLKLIKGLLDGPQFEILINESGDNAAKGQKKRRRRRAMNIGLIVVIVLGVLSFLIVGAGFALQARDEKKAAAAPPPPPPAPAPKKGSTSEKEGASSGHTCGRKCGDH